MTDIKDKCVQQLEEVLAEVEKAMKDIKAGDFDKATEVLKQLKSSYQQEKQNRKVS